MFIPWVVVVACAGRAPEPRVAPAPLAPHVAPAPLAPQVVAAHPAVTAPAPAASARNSRQRENHMTIMDARMDRNTCATIEVMK